MLLKGTVLQYILLLSHAIGSSGQTCRASPGTSSWPSIAVWDAFNQTLGGKLLKPLPPAAACHLGQPTYNFAGCAKVMANYQNTSFYTEDPIGLMAPNWQNDSCLPPPKLPCSGAGFPIYVVNATCAEDVVKGINFAKQHNIRLNVKGTGHDYLGRSVLLTPEFVTN